MQATKMDERSSTTGQPAPGAFPTLSPTAPPRTKPYDDLPPGRYPRSPQPTMSGRTNLTVKRPPTPSFSHPSHPVDHFQTIDSYSLHAAPPGLCNNTPPVPPTLNICPKGLVRLAWYLVSNGITSSSSLAERHGLVQELLQSTAASHPQVPDLAMVVRDADMILDWAKRKGIITAVPAGYAWLDARRLYGGDAAGAAAAADEQQREEDAKTEFKTFLFENGFQEVRREDERRRRQDEQQRRQGLGGVYGEQQVAAVGGGGGGGLTSSSPGGNESPASVRGSSYYKGSSVPGNSPGVWTSAARATAGHEGWGESRGGTPRPAGGFWSASPAIPAEAALSRPLPPPSRVSVETVRDAGDGADEVQRAKLEEFCNAVRISGRMLANDMPEDGVAKVKWAKAHRQGDV